MRKIRNLTAIVAALACALTAACSSGGGGGSAPVVQTAAAPTNLPPNEYKVPDTATLGINAPVLATGNTTLGTMPVNTVLPLRESIVLYTNSGVLADNGAEQGGATLTYKGAQTVNGVTGPVFQLDVPKMFVTQTLLPDGTGGPCCGFNDVNGKLNLLNYTMTGTWNAVNDGTTCSVCTSMFVTGFQTPSANVPVSGQATYLGNGANGSVSGNVYSGDGIIQAGTVSGSSSSFAVNFGSGQVTGTLSGLTATPISAAGVADTPQNWNQINITGSLSGAVLTGITSTPSQPAGSLGFGANSTGTIGGALFGPNAEELGAVWSLQDQAGYKTAFGVVSATKQ
ncbi:MAG TPA: transferrin-binding protein-like solute binding protein [Rhizomicrobium sp.]|nr:transferrin-binding protein-like solute binding protein [Rhizomicrobium sp.]